MSRIPIPAGYPQTYQDYLERLGRKFARLQGYVTAVLRADYDPHETTQQIADRLDKTLNQVLAQELRHIQDLIAASAVDNDGARKETIECASAPQASERPGADGGTARPRIAASKSSESRANSTASSGGTRRRPRTSTRTD